MDIVDHFEEAVMEDEIEEELNLVEEWVVENEEIEEIEVTNHFFVTRFLKYSINPPASSSQGL